MRRSERNDDNLEEIKENKGYILGEMEVSKAFWTLSIPAVLTMMAKAIYSAVDTIYIGRLKNNFALAAVGVVSPLLLILQSVETMLAQGVCVLVGRKLGENNRSEADNIVSTVLLTASLFGVICCLTGVAFMNPLLRLFGADEGILPYARQYGLWVFIGIVFNMPTAILNNAARGESAVKVASRGILAGTILNVLLDPIFIFDFGLGMGVAGASLATTISEAVSLAYIAAYYLRGKSLVELRFGAIHHRKVVYKQLILIGLPVAAFQFLLSVASAVTNGALKDLPDSEVFIAAFSVVQKVTWIIIFVFLGLVQGFQPIVSYAAGAGNRERFEKTVMYSGKVMAVTALLFTVLSILLGRTILSWFSSDAGVVSAGVWLLVSQTALSALLAVSFVVIIAYQALGSGVQGVILAVLRQAVLYIPLMLVLPEILGFAGVLLVQPISEAVTFTAAMIMVPALKRKSAAISEPELPV